MLSVVMLSAVMLHVNMMSVVAPFRLLPLTFAIFKICEIIFFGVNHFSKYFPRMYSS
jgi:hypothetical protein